MNKDDCIFCKIVKKEIPASIVFEDEELLAFKDINPIDKVHLLIIPKEHIENLFSCEKKHKELLSKMLLLAPKLAKENGMMFKLIFTDRSSEKTEAASEEYRATGKTKKVVVLK